MRDNKKELSKDKREAQLAALKSRFEKNMKLHNILEWSKLLTII